MTRDALGNTLNEGDTVSFALSLGQIVTGQIVRVSRIAQNPSDPSTQETVYVMFTLPLSVMPNGIVPGLVKAATETKVQA